MKTLLKIVLTLGFIFFVSCNNQKAKKNIDAREKEKIKIDSNQIKKKIIKNSGKSLEIINNSDVEFGLNKKDLNEVLKTKKSINSKFSDSLFHKASEIIYGDLPESEYSNGIKILTESAKIGNPNSIALLAECLMEGWRIEKNENQALMLFEHAVSLENESAMSALGHYYLKNKKPLKAIDYMERAIKSGNKFYQYDLAGLYLDGNSPYLGIPSLKYPELVNQKRGIELITLSADSGEMFAQQDLGIYYFKGKFVEKNDSLAKKYLSLAINNPEFIENESSSIITDNIKLIVGENWETWLKNK